uniref:Non-homologous end-joining factor 1 n=1 Tax=Oryzias latipes TaxID=8090 RepID=A0A3P9K6F8_ORYLA
MDTSCASSEDVLLQRHWIPICIDGCQFLAKSWFGEASYRVLLTDMRCMWEETMDAAATQSRAQELNRRLRASVTAFFSHLCEVAQPCLLGGNGEADRGAKITVTRLAADGLIMRLKSELAGLPFHWEFHCSPAPVSLVCVQLVRPLLGMSRLLQLQVDQLGRLLMRKDAEIQDYKENGATLSRERLQTDVFQEETYRENYLAKALPLLWSGSSDDLGFSADLQQLYATVVTHCNTRKRKLSEEDCSAAEEPDLALLQAAVGSVKTEPAEREVGTQEKISKEKTTDRPSIQQESNAAERQSSKPKKKKVGLFR